MANLGLNVLDRTVQETNRWLNEIADHLTKDKQDAYHALRAVLFTLRDRTPRDLTANLGAQLPLLVRGIYYESYDPSKEPLTYRQREEWNERVSGHFGAPTQLNPEDATRAVFTVLNEELDPGIVNKVKDSVPDDVKSLWPEPAQQTA